MRSLKISGKASRSRSNLAKFNPHHDSNGRFASGGAGGGAGLSVEEDLKNFDPNAPVPASPKNAGGVDAKTWDNWEHGVDGNQYVDLYRQHVGEKLGLDVPKSDLAPGGQLNYLTQRGFGGSSNETAQKQAESMVTAIANGTPNQPALYRGIVASATDSDSQALVKQFTNLRPGDTVDMPLVSTTRSLGVASWYAADRVASGTDSVMIKIQPGAKGISQSAKNSWYPADHEVVTSGKFEVVGVSKVQAPYWSRGVFEPRKIEFNDGSAPHFEVATYNKIRYSPTEAEHIWNTAKSGNIQSLATDTLKFTDDRRIGFGNTDRLVYSSWSKQAPKNFTVVEVKMIEPHVIQKAADFGMDFDLLFGGRPFIDDSVPVTKYNPNHDAHGRFASGSGGSGSNRLSHRDIYNLQANMPDNQKPAVYKAEDKYQPQIQRQIEQPRPPSVEALRKGEITRAEYDKGYKEYSKNFTQWSQESTRNIKSPMGEKHLNGTVKGTQNYVNDVTSQDWFVKEFGNGGVVGTPKVSLTDANVGGKYVFGFKNGQPYTSLSINKGYAKSEPVTIHEIAHYATVISQKTPFSGHGPEFAKNHIFIASKVIGDEYASGLEAAYKSEGVNLG